MKKRAVVLVGIMLVLTVLTLIAPNIKADVATSLNIIYGNTPPIAIGTIPDQVWAKNTNSTDSFDLDDYFIDNETITYTSSSVANITVVINETTNIVSFYSDTNFSGLRNVTFTASDGSLSADSNQVLLNVTEDLRAPTWSNQGKNKDDAQIFQNTVVTFSADWEDDVELSEYIFSAKQESGWINQSPANLSGTSDTSSYSLQISGPAGTVVEWRFFGFDTSGNMNATTIQTFTVSSTPVQDSTTTPTEEEDEDDTGSSNAGATPTSTVRDFIVDPLSGFKIDLKQGSSGVITVKITNLGNVDLLFDIEIVGLDEFNKIISEKKFNLLSGGSKTITIEFSAEKRLMPDIYFGTIRVKTSAGVKEVPVVITVKSVEVEYSLDVEIPPESKVVKPGENVKANITIRNLKELESRNVTLYYAITNFKGEVINSGFEEFTFYQQEIILEKSLLLPEELDKGEYIFLARAVSGKEIVIDSEVFTVEERFNVRAFIKTNYLWLILVIVILFVVIMMVRNQRNKERLRLLNLYLMISELNKLVKEGKQDQAIAMYVRIKAAYGEPLSNTAIKNKEELKKEMESLAEKFDVKVLQKLQEKTEEVKATPVEEKDKVEEVKEVAEGKVEEKKEEPKKEETKEEKKVDSTEKKEVIMPVKVTEDKKIPAVKATPVEEKGKVEEVKEVVNKKESKEKSVKNKKGVKKKNERKKSK